MSIIRVADYIIQRLSEEGIEHMFLVTGRGILYLSDALAKNENVKHISVHHEQAAAFAAVAYSQYNDKLGACLISTGCASTNAVTGVLNAWQDGVPCIFVSGQNKLHETVGFTGKPIRTYGSQEADILPVVSPITKYSTMIMDASSIGIEMDKAIHYATHGQKGPVWIDVPVDVQNMRVEPEELSRWHPQEVLLQPSIEEVDWVVDTLSKAERPVLLIGSGVRSAGAIKELNSFIEKFPFPVIFSTSAVDVYGTDHKLSIGAVGTIGGTRSGNFTIQNSDLIISIGCRLSPMLTGSEYTKFARAAKLLVIDIDINEHSKDTVKIDKVIVSDAKEFLKALIDRNVQSANVNWIESCLHWKTLFPKCEDVYKDSEKVDLYYLGECLSQVVSDDAVILTDSGLEEIIIPSVMDFKKGQRCLHPASQGCMGVALPAAIGAYYSCNHSVTAVIGDGSIMMNLQELQTISSYKIPVKIIIVNNNAYSVIRKRQVELFRTRTIGTDPANGVECPDFEKVANCFGISYMKIENTNELLEKLIELEKMEGAVICEIMAVDDQDYIRSSAAFNSNRKFVNRPLEDQFPFIDRELFKNEMIIEPIDI